MRPESDKKEILANILREVSNLHNLPALPISEFIAEVMKRAFDVGYDAAEVDALNSHRLSSNNSDKTFTVRVRRVSVAQIEVKASDTSSAENKVEEMMSKGDLPDLQWEINLERIESVVEL